MLDMRHKYCIFYCLGGCRLSLLSQKGLALIREWTNRVSGKALGSISHFHLDSQIFEPLSLLERQKLESVFEGKNFFQEKSIGVGLHWIFLREKGIDLFFQINP